MSKKIEHCLSVLEYLYKGYGADLPHLNKVYDKYGSGTREHRISMWYLTKYPEAIKNIAEKYKVGESTIQDNLRRGLGLDSDDFRNYTLVWLVDKNDNMLKGKLQQGVDKINPDEDIQMIDSFFNTHRL